MITITSEDDLSVSPLTPSEIHWIKKLDFVLRNCPDRLELVTIGDPSLQVVDKGGALRSELGDGEAGRDGVVLATISGGPVVHGVSG